MSEYTQWYNLDKYVGTDKPNLLDQYNSSMEKIDSAMRGLQNQINGGTDIEALEERVDSLELKSHNYYSDKNIVFIGDSFTTGAGCSDYSTTKKKRFSSLICSWLNATEFNFSVGSTGFVKTNGGVKFSDELTTASSQMSQAEKDNTACVVITGGINDVRFSSGDYDTMMVNAAECVELAKTYFPKAFVLVVPMLWYGRKFEKLAESYYQAIVSGAKSTHNAAVVEGAYTWCFGDRDSYNSDNLHPTDKGYLTIARNIERALVFGELENWEDQFYDLTYVNTDKLEPTAATLANGFVHIKHGIVYITTLALHCLQAISSNTSFATIPNAVTPFNTKLGTCGTQSNTLNGSACVTNSGYMYINPALINYAIDNNAFTSTFTYPLYGNDYNA